LVEKLALDKTGLCRKNRFHHVVAQKTFSGHLSFYVALERQLEGLWGNLDLGMTVRYRKQI
jgi:hypothetical protein